MGGKNSDKRDTINTIFCDRCGTLYGKIQVTEDVMIPMCPVCHRELFVYFVDDDSKFVHFGDMELFAEIAEKIESATDKLQFSNKDLYKRRYDSIPRNDFVNSIRERTRKMNLIESRFKPKTVLGAKR